MSESLQRLDKSCRDRWKLDIRMEERSSSSSSLSVSDVARQPSQEPL